MDIKNKKIMHIDTSIRFFQRGTTGIAYKILETGNYKGIILTSKLKKELKSTFNLKNYYEKLYAICIYYLIKDSLDLFDILIICNDEKYSDVKYWLDRFFEDNKKYKNKEIISISYLRKITGNKNLRSSADKLANIYRRKGAKNGIRRQRGTKLNLVDFNFMEMIYLIEK